MVLPIIDRLVDRSKEEPEYFLALEITETHIKSAAWIVVSGQTEVVATGSTSYWQGKDASELITSADSSLAGLAQKLTSITKKVPSKVILGLPALWVDQDNRIILSRGDLLKELTQKLELSPLGFVVSSEALVQYLKDQEGVPPSAIFVGLEDEEIEVTLIHLGKVIGRTKVARSVELGSDLEEGLTRFLPQAIFPSRILLFDGHAALEESRQQLLNHPWQAKGNKLPFLHFPKVEVLRDEETIKAVAVAGGAEAARAIGLPIAEKQLTPKTQENPATDSSQPPSEEETQPEISSQDIVTENVPEAEVPPTPAAPEPEKFGFIIGQDIAKVSPSVSPHVDLSQVIEPPLVKPSPPPPPIKVPRKLPSFHLPSLPGNLKIVGLILLSCLAVFALGAILWWNFAKATITLEVQARTIDKSATLVIDPKAASPDTGSGVLPGNFFQGTGTGQQSISATGQKLVGTKAKGTVVIYNNTSKEIDLKAGSIITSDTGFKFALDNVTVVASPSGTADNPTPGQTSVTITAQAVGPEYNLAAGSSFSIPGFTTVQVVAKNLDAIGGGDKRQVQAVSVSDKDKLLAQIASDLNPKAMSNLSENIPQDYQLLGSSITYKITSQTFDKNVGDEGTSLGLTATVTAQALAIPKSALSSYLTDLGKNDFSEDFTVSLENSDFALGDVKILPDNTAKVSAKMKVVAIPIVDRESLAREVAGQPPSKVDGIFSHLPGFIRSQFSLVPELPGPLSVFPKNPQRITIDVNISNL